MCHEPEREGGEGEGDRENLLPHFGGKWKLLPAFFRRGFLLLLSPVIATDKIHSGLSSPPYIFRFGAGALPRRKVINFSGPFVERVDSRFFPTVIDDCRGALIFREGSRRQCAYLKQSYRRISNIYSLSFSLSLFSSFFLFLCLYLYTYIIHIIIIFYFRLLIFLLFSHLLFLLYFLSLFFLHSFFFAHSTLCDYYII